MKANNVLLSLGAALATSKIAKTISRLDADDVLGTMGLARRRNYFLQDAALIGAGAVVGAGIALLFAPSSGVETRAKLSRKIEALGEAATDALREVKNELPSLQIARPASSNHERVREHHS